MKSVGEVMSIARSFEEAIQKAARMLGDGYNGVIDVNYPGQSKRKLLLKLQQADTMRLFTICAALRAGITVAHIQKQTGIDRWFLYKLAHIVAVYHALLRHSFTKRLMAEAKQTGFSDQQIADITGFTPGQIRMRRIRWGIVPVVKRIDTMAGEFPAVTNYCYMTYHARTPDRVPDAKGIKVMILGCGPYSVGTSVEFDWSAVTTSAAIRSRGVKSIMVNCNPETVSTDYDVSDTLYFEELTLERVLDISSVEGNVPVIVSVGGQISNNLASGLARQGIRILGTSPRDIYRAEHRQTFARILDRLRIPQPRWANARSAKQALGLARRIGYPVLARPSFVLSGKAMSVLSSPEQLIHYMTQIPVDLRRYPLVLSKFLSDAVECDLDGVARKGRLIISAVSEHVENGGVHSGDSTIVFPAHTMDTCIRQTIGEYAEKIVHAFNIHGPFNIQFLVIGSTVFVIECNCRASRSFPFVSKALGVNFIEIAAKVAMGLNVRPVTLKDPSYWVVKVPQFSFHKLREADPALKVEMNSTGEVAAFGTTVGDAYGKAILATGVPYPSHHGVFVSLGGRKNKLRFLPVCKKLHRAGYTLYATGGTGICLRGNGIPAVTTNPRFDRAGMPALDVFSQKKIDFAVVVPDCVKPGSVPDDERGTEGYIMRRHAVDSSIPVFTNIQTADFFVRAITAYTPDSVSIAPWDEYVKQKGGSV